MGRPAHLVLGVVIIPTRRVDVGHGQRTFAHHGGGQFATGDEFLDHDLGRHGIIQLWRAVVFDLDKVNTDG